jgi:hypothetical protein
MRQEPYRELVLTAKAEEIGDHLSWRARVFIERTNHRGWGQVPPLPGLDGQWFASKEDALSAALAHGRHYVDGILGYSEK